MPGLNTSCFTELQTFYMSHQLLKDLNFIWKFALAIGLPDCGIEYVLTSLKDLYPAKEIQSEKFRQMFLYKLMVYRREKMSYEAFDSNLSNLLDKENLGDCMNGMPIDDQ